jgi:hypothetical protein
MCEACGPTNPRPRTPEEQAAFDKVMANLREHIDKHFDQRGVTRDQLLDPDCYGTSRQKIGTWLQDQFFNLRIAFGFV